MFKLEVNAIMNVDINDILDEEIIGSFYVEPIYKNDEIIAFQEVITKRILATRTYENDYAIDTFYLYDSNSKDSFYKGDVSVNIKNTLATIKELKEQKKYMKQSVDEVNKKIDKIPKIALKKNCTEFRKDSSPNYYNREIFICYLDNDHYLLVTASKDHIISSLTGIEKYTFKELITGKKIAKMSFFYREATKEEECHLYKEVGINKIPTFYTYGSISQLVGYGKNIEIPSIDMHILAPRQLTTKEMNDYLNYKPDDIKYIINDFLREDYHKSLKDNK